MLRNALLSILLPLMVIYSTICVFLYFFQEKIIFRPELLPADHQYRFNLAFDELNYDVKKGVSINALKFKIANPKGVVYYLHGNSGSLQSWGNEAHHFVNNGYDVLLIDYRGFGKSTGKMSQKGLYEDVNYIYRQLAEEYGEDRIIVYGRSIGTGFAANVCSQNSPKELILEAPYYSFKDLASHFYPWLPLSILLRYQLRTDKFIPKITCRIHIFHGTDDKVVYHGSTEKLAKLLKPEDKIFSIKGGTHNDLDLWPEYQENIVRILNKE